MNKKRSRRRRSRRLHDSRRRSRRSSARAPTSLEDLVGKKVTGRVVCDNDSEYCSLRVEKVDSIPSYRLESTLLHLSQQYLRNRNVSWRVGAPHSWYRHGPHVTVNAQEYMHNDGGRFTLSVAGVMHWETENSRWVALVLKGPLVSDWVLHLSSAQERLPLR